MRLIENLSKVADSKTVEGNQLNEQILNNQIKVMMTNVSATYDKMCFNN